MMSPPATTTAGMPDEYTNPRVRAGSCDASRTAATTPTYIASPPIRGVGCRWTSRSRGYATAPSLRASTRTHPVAK